MGTFLELEKQRQVAWLAHTEDVENNAKHGGLHSSGRYLPYCLPPEHSTQNLMPGIREEALRYFAANGISWHDATNGGPSTHLADSQVCCVNFLMPLGTSEGVLLALFQRYFPNINSVLPMDTGASIAFEWIGAENYLKEKVKPSEARSRGAMCTSVDAAVMFGTTNGQRIIVLIEWKYTESYTGLSLRYSKNGTDRTHIYQHLWDKETCPIDQAKAPTFESLFHEPFYQFMRQQCLASEMRAARELGADEVYLMHLSPRANIDFRAVTSAELRHLGSTATEVWKGLQKDSSKFLPVYTEDFFDRNILAQDPTLAEYRRYVASRYGSILDLPVGS